MKKLAWVQRRDIELQLKWKTDAATGQFNYVKVSRKGDVKINGRKSGNVHRGDVKINRRHGGIPSGDVVINGCKVGTIVP